MAGIFNRLRRQYFSSLPVPAIFSDDEAEQKFIAEVTSESDAFWAPLSIPWNTIHNEQWVRRGKLGEGSFGEVYVGQRSRDHKLFAVKSSLAGLQVDLDPEQYRKQRRKLELQFTEVKMMRLLKYKYIVRCLGCGRSNGMNGINNQPTLDVFQEYLVRGSLKHICEQRGSPFPEDPFVRQYTYDLLKALQYMRTKKIVHGDIKMDNLLLGDDCIKLADWGGAKVLTPMSWKQTLIGTVGFRAPEVRFQRYQDYYADIFSVGCTVVEMLTAYSPEVVSQVLFGLDPQRRATLVKDRSSIPSSVSDICKDFLKHCFYRKSLDRWTAEELLHHPFIANRDKTNRSPYEMALPSPLGHHLLRHPVPPVPELSDSTPTNRVRAYLRGPNIPAEWSRNLPPSPDRDPEPSSIVELPRVQPDVDLFETEAKKSDEVLRALAGVAKPVNSAGPRSRKSRPDAPEKGTPEAGAPLEGPEAEAVAVIHQQYRGTMAAMQKVNDEYGKRNAGLPSLSRVMGCRDKAALEIVIPPPPAWRPGREKPRSL